MSAAREVKDPASARGEVRPEGRVRARAVAPTRDNSFRDALQRGARTLKCRTGAGAADTQDCIARCRCREAAHA
jgi:hypothetical protein